jgi:hypothetical protein
MQAIRKELLVETSNGSSGLCMTCNNAPTCIYRAARGPVLLCETFDTYTNTNTPPVALANRRPGAGPTYAQVLEPVESETNSFSGLCVNCQHRATCVHPRPAGGVWHCEDYD